MKRFFALIVSVVMIFVAIINVHAVSNDNIGIKSLIVDDETICYANSVLPRHLHSFFENSGKEQWKSDNIFMGEPFTVFNVKSNQYSSCFPIIKDHAFFAILEVAKIENEFNSSLSTSFAQSLNTYLSQKLNKCFVLLTDGVVLQVFDGDKCFEIFRLYGDKVNATNLSIEFNYKLSEIPKTVNYQTLLKKQSESSVYSFNTLIRGYDGPKSYKTLNVAGVSQSGNTCWAATCAALINYFTGSNLSDISVATYVFGNNWNQGGNWSHIKAAYNHWGLYPSQTNGTISFNTVKSNINANKPLHLGLNGTYNGHSVGLIGYEDWVGSPGGNNERILILLEPNGGIHRSVTLNSSGNFSYSLGGGYYSWSKTRKF